MWWWRRKPKRKTVISKPVKIQGVQLSADIHATEGFTKKELAFYLEAIELCVHCINTLEFKLAVLNTEMTLKKGMSNSEIFDLVMSGKDAYNPEPDGDFDLSISLFYKNNSVIGYTYKNTFRTWMNRKFFSFSDRGKATLASNAAHEYMHNLGFGHPSRRYTRREVPYVYGQIVYDLAMSHLEGRVLTPLKDSNAFLNLET